MSDQSRPEISLTPSEGWHCAHHFYLWDRTVLECLDPDELAEGRRQFQAALEPVGGQVPVRLQTMIVAGHKADFGWMGLDPDPLKLSGVHQALLASKLGPALRSAWSYVSLTEVSEYMPSVEAFGAQLVAEGLATDSDEHRTRVEGYARRLEIMRRQRLTPDLPVWPAVCFYPMNKRRGETENWFLLEFKRRAALMAEHGESGMKFGGKVTQLVTVGIGLDDWEWGVTLWARNPQFLSQIVYRMRFDEASARYGEFGPFFSGYLCNAGGILDHCRIGR